LPKFDFWGIVGRLPAEQEQRYRAYYLASDIRHTIYGVLLVLIPVLLFAYTDYLLFGFASAFYYLTVVRLTFLLVCVVFILALRNVKDATSYDWLIFSLAILGTSFNFMIQTARPAWFVQGYVLDIVFIFCFYMVVQCRLLLRTVAALAFTMAGVILILMFRQPLNPLVANVIFFTYFAGNVAGLLVSVNLTRQRRGQFKILEEEMCLRADVARLAELDELTGLYNRRKFLELTEKEAEKCKRYQRPFSFMMLDLDHFKTVNDTYGHQAGDTVLRSFADVVKGQIRNVDVIGRLGGEEFGIVLVETRLDAARVVAERIRQAVAGSHLHFTEKDSVAITVSIGLTEAADSDCVVDHIMSKADTALYKVKGAGRDHVEIVN
jgi:diguanylate cyclase (GGDEF)-like protein